MEEEHEPGNLWLWLWLWQRLCQVLRLWLVRCKALQSDNFPTTAVLPKATSCRNPGKHGCALCRLCPFIKQLWPRSPGKHKCTVSLLRFRLLSAHASGHHVAWLHLADQSRAERALGVENWRGWSVSWLWISKMSGAAKDTRQELGKQTVLDHLDLATYQVIAPSCTCSLNDSGQVELDCVFLVTTYQTVKHISLFFSRWVAVTRPVLSLIFCETEFKRESGTFDSGSDWWLRFHMSQEPDARQCTPAASYVYAEVA